jgi:hypothetical protein
MIAKGGYPYIISSDFFEYEFISLGPKGGVKKIVTLLRVSDNPLVYNLSLGDFNEVTGKVVVDTVTNNLDLDRILKTIAAIVFDFTSRFPEAMVVVEGSTDSRKRLYQRNISNFLTSIHQDFIVYGFLDGKWEFFLKNKTYQAILVRRF